MNAVVTAIDTCWAVVCQFDDLVDDVGVRALLGDEQVAVFKVSGEARLFAISAMDPFSQAPVLSRGIVGDVGGVLVVASPMYKQHFDLFTGVCVEDDSVRVKTYSVRVTNGQVYIASTPQSGDPNGASHAVRPA